MGINRIVAWVNFNGLSNVSDRVIGQFNVESVILTDASVDGRFSVSFENDIPGTSSICIASSSTILNDAGAILYPWVNVRTVAETRAILEVISSPAVFDPTAKTPFLTEVTNVYVAFMNNS